MTDEITKFLADVYKPSNLDSAPEKLRKAIKLLEGVLIEQMGVSNITKVSKKR